MTYRETSSLELSPEPLEPNQCKKPIRAVRVPLARMHSKTGPHPRKAPTNAISLTTPNPITSRGVVSEQIVPVIEVMFDNGMTCASMCSSSLRRDMLCVSQSGRGPFEDISKLAPPMSILSDRLRKNSLKRYSSSPIVIISAPCGIPEDNLKVVSSLKSTLFFPKSRLPTSHKRAIAINPTTEPAIESAKPRTRRFCECMLGNKNETI